MSVHPTKTQISLGIRPVWSESSLCAQWIAKDLIFLHADIKDSDQTGLSIFPHYQIRFSCGHARVLAFEYKSAHADICFKNVYTVKLLEDRPESAYKVKCLNLQRNASNLDWLSVLVHQTFLRDRHHCTKRSTPLQLSSICFTLQKQDGQTEENV